MRKRLEQLNLESCLNRAALDEMLFVLRGHDVAAPATIRFWISERVRLGKNGHGDPQLIEAEQCAADMEHDQRPPIDTTNQLLIGRMGGHVVIQRPLQRLTPNEALTVAAWLVALADPDATVPFAKVLQAVQDA